MNPELEIESERLERSWMRHDQDGLRDYLVSGVEDPRINAQSILTRHFIIQSAFGNVFQDLFIEEYRFSAAINALLELQSRLRHPEDVTAVLHALSHGSDNAEGLELAPCILTAFQGLPKRCAGVEVPSYVDSFLRECARAETPATNASLDTFLDLWASLFANQSLAKPLWPRPPTLLEPACGSANDYRFLRKCGIDIHVEYAGFDLCQKNVENARTLFPDARFEVGNVFELPWPDRSFDMAYTHDLFEHLSSEGIEASVRELCRVMSYAMCVHFFNMDEIRDHRVQPYEEYHWNKLSMCRMKDLFASHGFDARVLHVDSFLRHYAGLGTHNPNAYSFLLERKAAVGERGGRRGGG